MKTRNSGWLIALTLWGALALPALSAEPQPVRITSGPEQKYLDFSAGDNLVGRYHIAPGEAKPYFWPLNGPTGVPVTRAWPMVKGQPGESTDHVHQKSAWFCHGDVIPEGIAITDKVSGVAGVDFWAEGKGHGRILCTTTEPARTKSNHGQVTTRNEWVMADGKKILNETRTIHLYDFGDTRLFVFDIDLHASVCPITFGDTKEGSLGIRVNDSIREERTEGKKKVKGDGKLENADGRLGETACWGQQSRWCDYSGPIDGKVVGIAILDAPSNRFPVCWHSRGYGLMAANPFGRQVSKFPAMKERTDLVRLAKDEHLKLRYGLLIHPGDAREGKVADFFERFVNLKDAKK